MPRRMPWISGDVFSREWSTGDTEARGEKDPTDQADQADPSDVPPARVGNGGRNASPIRARVIERNRLRACFPRNMPPDVR